MSDNHHGTDDGEDWDIVQVLADDLNVNTNVARNLIHMVEQQECTVPFLARYRKEQTDGMEATQLRKFVDSVKDLRNVQKKADTIIASIQKQGKLTPALKKSIKACQTLEELNLMNAPFKGDKKRSLADRARNLGLQEAADEVLGSREKKPNLRRWVSKKKGLTTLNEVEAGVRDIISDHISKHKLTLEATRKILSTSQMKLHSILRVQKSASTKIKADNHEDCKENEAQKYEIYFDFHISLFQLKPYQILAINRGEAQKHLSVKVEVSERNQASFLSWCKQKWVNIFRDCDSQVMLNECVSEAYKRLILPLVLRNARAELTKRAQFASVEVFCHNLKKLLLTAPVRGKIVLGVDPGFKNGCKCAVVSSTGGEILSTDVFNLNHQQEARRKLSALYVRCKFAVIGIGNGTACRETENFISQFIREKRYSELAYCIVNENGASIYSVTDEAAKEMPDLDPNLRSAVSIARRLQDPLVELVKIEPKHLGVGMYQHDIPSTMMKSALNSVVEDCVTFVGVDLNVAGPSLLSRVAGIKANHVKKILEFRKKNGRFICRLQLLDVPGIGEKTFQQCSGFVRVSKVNSSENDKNNNKDSRENEENIPSVKREANATMTLSIKDEIEDPTFTPETTKKLGQKRKLSTSAKSGKKKKMTQHFPDPLDQTQIHPESYEPTRRFLKMINCDTDQIGTDSFISKVKQALSKKSESQYAAELGIGEFTFKFISGGLTQPMGYRDIREESSKPLFRQGMKSPQDLKCGDVIRGRVTNLAGFGVFVDIGVGMDGLIHSSQMNWQWEKLKHILGPNDIVVAQVIKLELYKKRIGLRLISTEIESTNLFK